MKAKIHDINFEYAEEKEKELRHDVMSHIHALGQQCPGVFASLSSVNGRNMILQMLRRLFTLARPAATSRTTRS